MRRLLLVVALFVASVVVMGARSGCGSADPATTIWLANYTDNPFHPNGGNRLEMGASRDVIKVRHGAVGHITIERNSTRLATLAIQSVVPEEDTANYEVVVRLTEDENKFNFELDKLGFVTVSITYP